MGCSLHHVASIIILSTYPKSDYNIHYATLNLPATLVSKNQVIRSGHNRVTESKTQKHNLSTTHRLLFLSPQTL